MYARIIELRRMLQALDPTSPPLKRFIYVATYLYLSVMYYRRLMQSSPIFQGFRLEATTFIHQYQPKGTADLNLLVYYSLFIMHTWKNEAALEQGGLLLVANIKRRFPEFRDWKAVRRMVKAKFGYLERILAEWEDSWSQSQPDQSTHGLLI